MTSSPFDPFIVENGFLLLDGGLATELEAQASAKKWTCTCTTEHQGTFSHVGQIMI